MKRPSFTLQTLLTKGTVIFKTNTVAYSIIALTLIFLSNQTLAQTVTVDCNTIMSCNDGVQISLDGDCSMYIEPDMILEAPAYGDSLYDVEAKLPNGTLIPSVVVDSVNGLPVRRPLINGSHIGLTLQVKVSLRGCGNACWGNALIEDKLPPVVTTCPCEERITSFDTLLTGMSLTYNRPSGSICDPMGVGFYTNTQYGVFRFAVDVSGIVDINIGNSNVALNLYQISFDPLNPCTNIVQSNFTTFSGSLTAGINYYLVVSAQTPLPLNGMLAINLLSIDSQVGNIKSSAAPSSTVCTLACNGEVALLNQTANNATNRPTFVDSCGGPITYTKFDYVENLMCAERFSKIIRREWTARDARGNVSEVKVQYFYINRARLADVVCPADFIRSCNFTFATLPNGAPTPAVSGQPTNIDCANIQVYYNDVVFDICGAGVKVFRQWNIIDWCTGEDLICGQTIKIIDDIAPIVTCPIDRTSPLDSTTVADVISTKSTSCTADWQVRAPIVINDCSATTYTVLIKVADALGNDPGPSTPFSTQDGLARVTGTYPNYTIVDLPLGRTWIKYIVTDECGNFTECFTEVDVVDRTPPTAICEGTTVVSLEDTGSAELYAESLDDHSNDNCGIDRFEVRRKNTFCAGYVSDLEFGPKVNFCCSDVTSPSATIAVILRVYDNAGNYNDCETTVRVQNKRRPVITCPPNVTLTCGDSRIAGFANPATTFIDTAFFGRPTISGVCGNLVYNSRLVTNGLNSCGFGSIVREYFLVSDPTVFCRQTLTVQSPIFNGNNIIFPDDIEINSCNLDDATPEALNSKPIVNASGCSQIGISKEDQLFYDAPNVCVKILRTWRVIDWCTFSPNNNGTIFEDTQVIKLKGTNAPVFTSSCANRTFDTNPLSCDLEVTLTATAQDDCTDDEDLKYTYTLDINKNNTIDASGNTNTFTRILPVGTHRVTFTVTNRCGTSASCSYDVIIRSSKKPTPVCLGEVVWVVDANGRAEVWASDFDRKSEGACGSTDNLRFSFNSAGTQPSRIFTCADIPNGQVASIPLKMYVIDPAGNFDYCDVVLILQDSPLNNACADNAGLLPTVAGRIVTEMEDGLDGVEVGLKNETNSVEVTEMTENDGKYLFTGVDVFDPKTIRAYNNQDILNGISTLDLVLIQRHILGLQTLQTPYKLLAADINNSRSITASDLTLLRKLILGITTTFDNNTSWRFVPSEYTFSDPAYPFDFPSKINVDSIFEDKSNVNFTAIKVGDVNNSAQANATSNNLEVRSSDAVIVADEVAFNKGQKVSINYRFVEDMNVMGAQFAIRFDATELTYNGVDAGKWDISGSHINATRASEGLLLVSYDKAEGQLINTDDVVMTLQFVAKNDGVTTNLHMDNSALKSELYEIDGSIRPLQIHARNQVQAEGITLFQNEPNPFKNYTKISFTLPSKEDIKLRIFDINGKVVHTINQSLGKGAHSLQVEREMLGAAGMYYYQLEAGAFTSTKKMILIE